MTERNPYHPDGLWPTAGSYTRTDEGAHIGPDGEVDWHGLYLSENRRAEKAERERDEWKDSAIKAMADLERAEHPRPLTPDAITVEMCRRAYRAFEKSASWEDALTAALTDPPARPEGAEEIHRVLDAIYQDEPGITHRGNLADTLATYGVRVTGAES